MPFMQKFLELKLSACLISIHASLVTHGGSMDGRTVTGVPGGLLFACLLLSQGLTIQARMAQNFLISCLASGMLGLQVCINTPGYGEGGSVSRAQTSKTVGRTPITLGVTSKR